MFALSIVNVGDNTEKGIFPQQEYMVYTVRIRKTICNIDIIWKI